MTTGVPTTTVFVDSNVWLYAFIAGQDPRKTERARHVIQTASTIIVSTQVINEVGVQLIKREKYTEEQTRAVISDFLSPVYRDRTRSAHLTHSIGAA